MHLQKSKEIFHKFFLNNHNHNLLKLRHYEKATKFKKNLPPVLTKQLFYSVALIQVGYFFQIFQAFSEKLDFNIRQIKKVFAYTFLGPDIYSTLFVWSY